MYTVNVQVQGISPLMQHRFPMPDGINPKPKKNPGEVDYSNEWKDYFYSDKEGNIFQPSIHFDGCLVKAATSFKVRGQRGKSYKDLFRGNVFCGPDEISHNMKVPETLDTDADKPLYLDCRPVVIQRSRVVRIRPTFKAGWKLDFEIQVLEDEIPADVVQEVLALAGRTVGIGDFRPRFGRFMVTKFEVVK